jgi:cobalt-zinc-cadmium efflux system membrane fusion protein
MKYSLSVSLLALVAGWSSCKHSPASQTEATTFVLSDTMMASVRIDTTTVKRYNEDIEMPAIPTSAVIFDKGRDFVIVFRDKYNIDKREIAIFKSLNDISYISKGLQPGDKVISRNQLPIYEALKK